jgi:uncharacterized membrane protein
MKREFITIIGFAFFLLGFIALFLTLVGLNLTIFSFLEDLPTPFPFVSKILLIIIGFVIIYTSKFSRREDTRN